MSDDKEIDQFQDNNENQDQEDPEMDNQDPEEEQQDEQQILEEEKQNQKQDDLVQVIDEPKEDPNIANIDEQQPEPKIQKEIDENQYSGNYNDLVQQHLSEINEAFDQMVGKDMDGNLGLEAACNLIDEIGNIIQRDCEEAKNQLRNDDRLFQDEESIQFMTFMEYFQIWAQNKGDELGGQLHSQQDFDNLNYPVDQQKIQRSMPEYQPTKQQMEQMKGKNIYSQHNQMIINRFFRHHAVQFQSYFNEYSREVEIPKVLASEIPLVMRVGFYIDNITIHESKEDQEEFLNKQDSYKIMMAHLDRFIEVGEYQPYPDVNTFRMNYNQFLQFLQYFIDNEPNIFIRQGADLDLNIATEDSQQNKLIIELNQNIQNYQQMLEETSAEKDRQVISNMLSALYDQLNKLQQSDSVNNRTTVSKKKALTRNEQRKKNLQEIFIFYCKQQYSKSGSHGITIERVIQESSVLNVGKFMLFAKQYSLVNICLKLTKNQLPILFKKSASNYKDMGFEEFQQFLEKIALLIYEDKSDNFPNDNDKIEAFYQFIGLDNQDVYRQKMQVLNPPFNIQEKEDFRLLPKDQGRKVVLKELQPQQKEELEKRKREKDFIFKKYQAMIPQPLPSSSKMNSSQTTANLPKNPPQHYIYDSYQTKKDKNQKKVPEISQKITWQQLENLEYNDLQKDKLNKFKPTDLFDENENFEDKQYLGQFSLQDDKIKKQQEMIHNRQHQEGYGQYKQGLRPTEKIKLSQDPNYSLKKNSMNNIHRHHASQDTFEMNPIYLNPGYISPQPQQYNQFQNLNNYSTKNYNQSIGQNYMQRANQLDQQERMKEKRMMQQIQGQGQNYQQYKDEKYRNF